jgi:hypothetical protein
MNPRGDDDDGNGDGSSGATTRAPAQDAALVA